MSLHPGLAVTMVPSSFYSKECLSLALPKRTLLGSSQGLALLPATKGPLRNPVQFLEKSSLTVYTHNQFVERETPALSRRQIL